MKPKVLSDLNGGRTDRVVVEWELEDLSEALAVGSEWDEDVGSQKNMQTGLSDYRKLSTTPKSRFGKLIEYGFQKINRLPEPRAAQMRPALFYDLRASCVGVVLTQEGTSCPVVSWSIILSIGSTRLACRATTGPRRPKQPFEYESGHLTSGQLE